MVSVRAPVADGSIAVLVWKTMFTNDEVGLDDAIKYRRASDLKKVMGEACPNGVDIYYLHTAPS